jgi:integrase
MHVERMVAAKAATPASARNFLHVLRRLMAHCVAVGMTAINPTQGVKAAPIKTTGFRSWEEYDIDRFRQKHPVGSRARLALELALHTGQRRGDLVRLGRQHIRDGVLTVRQQKTGVTLSIPVHPELVAVLEETPGNHLTFLTTSTGKPFSAAGFTNWFREVCDEAGLPKGTSAHGLRKACCRRLAEAGCSANVIAAVSGHVSLREVQNYTRAADQKRMARTAIDTVISAFPASKK